MKHKKIIQTYKLYQNQMSHSWNKVILVCFILNSWSSISSHYDDILIKQSCFWHEHLVPWSINAQHTWSHVLRHVNSAQKGCGLKPTWIHMDFLLSEKQLLIEHTATLEHEAYLCIYTYIIIYIYHRDCHSKLYSIFSFGMELNYRTTNQQQQRSISN